MARLDCEHECTKNRKYSLHELKLIEAYIDDDVENLLKFIEVIL